MQILEHQSLCLRNLISCQMNLTPEKLPSMLQYVLKNASGIGITPSNRILVTEHPNESENFEILIPIQSKVAHCDSYTYKEQFKLFNAVLIRHEGDFSILERTKQRLLEYITEKKYQAISEPYYSIVRLSPKNPKSCIIDIYVSISLNVL